MRIHRPPTLLLVLLALLGLVSQRLGSSPLGADEPPKNPAKPDAEKGEGEGEEGDDDFFDGETSFSQKQVDIAIDKGVAWLKKKQRADGSWGELSGGQAYGGGNAAGGIYPHAAGPTALALYTLLKCKVNPKDPGIVKGFKWLKESNNDIPGSSYESSMVLLAVTATADQAKTSKASEKNAEKVKLSGEMRGWAQKLVEDLMEKRQAKGAWRYNVSAKKGTVGPTPGGEEDLSSTQLAALALFAAHRAGIKVKDKVWEEIITFALGNQDEDGPAHKFENSKTGKTEDWKARGFCYIKGEANPEEGQAVGSMTACGVGCLMMSRFILSDAGRKKEAWDARPDAPKIQSAINDGLAWLDLNWSNFDNPKKRQTNVYTIYWLYSFERMMDLIGLQRLGKHMWYSEMGQQLLNRQAEDGHWKTGTTLEPQDTLDTCFALLFLKRATKGAIPNPSLTGGSDDAPVDNR
jgi:hypothetical protein